jgi:Septum formation
MAALTGVNEGSPQEPVDPASAQAEPAPGALLETEPAEAAGSQTAPAEAREAEAQAVEAEVTEKEPAGDGGGAEAELGAAEPDGAGLADAEPGEAGPEEASLEEAGLEEAGLEVAGLEEAKPTRDMSPLAVAGVVFGLIALVAVAVGVLAVVTHGFHRKTVVTYRPAAVFALRPGECLDSGTSGLSFTLLACSKPHDAEVFARFALTGSSWPGSTAVQQEAGNGCAGRLDSYLNPQLASAGLAQEYVYPDQTAWQAGERTVVCEVRSPTGPLTGSVRNPG